MNVGSLATIPRSILFYCVMVFATFFVLFLRMAIPCFNLHRVFSLGH